MTDRVVLVTGGGTGIGAAVARQLAKAGDRVVICGRRPEPLQRVAEPTGALAVVADVSEASGVTTVVTNHSSSPASSMSLANKWRRSHWNRTFPTSNTTAATGIGETAADDISQGPRTAGTFLTPTGKRPAV